MRLLLGNPCHSLQRIEHAHSVAGLAGNVKFGVELSQAGHSLHHGRAERGGPNGVLVTTEDGADGSISSADIEALVDDLLG